MAKEFAGCDDLVFLCGHYEGIDERVLEEVVTDYVSIGDYVLTGGELAAMVMIDAISRLVPGVLKNAESAETESFSGNLLEYPQYSRPEIWHGKAVPEVLLSGDGRKIRQWRIEKAEERTRERRPDLYKKYEAVMECRKRLMSQKLLHMDMIDLIDRGKAELVLKRGGHILLRDIESGFYYHTAFEAQGDRESISFWSGLEPELKSDIKTITLHQPAEIDHVRKYLSLELMMTCYQYVCTRREKLSVSGLYRTDGKENENGLVICPATQEYCGAIDELYSLSHGPNYIRDRIDRGCLFVALVHGELAGFVGMHEEGGLGMLEVLPQFRRQHVALALSTFIINWALEQGYTPYSQAKADNEASIALQDKLDIHRAKEQLFWMGTFT
jgi:tRNA (guanine37-N1)-methyltransferase